MPAVSWQSQLGGGPGANREAMLEWGLRYEEMGWGIVDGPGVEWGVCACSAGDRCRAAGKHARGIWGKSRGGKVLSREEIRWVWGEERIRGSVTCPNMFVVCHLSQLVVLDIDYMDKFDALVASGDYEIPETLMARSGSGRGLHLLYRREWDVGGGGDIPRLRSSIPGGAGEVKWNGYFVAPPSVHRSGGAYEWVNWGMEIAAAPEWLGAEKPRWRGSMAGPPAAGVGEGVRGKWSAGMVSAWMADVADYCSCGGRRPVVGVAIAARGGSLAEWGLLDGAEVERLMMIAAERNQWVADAGEDDVRRQIRNGIEMGREDARGE